MIISKRSPANYLKLLYSKLEISLDEEEKKKISFIGISNLGLDAAKMSQVIFLSIPDILLDDIYLIVESISKSYDEDFFYKY